MRILVACEESQAVTIELRKLGHEAYSADIQDCSGGHPEWHLKGDCLPLLQLEWEMIIAFPPCTHLTYGGVRWFKQKKADGRQQAGIDLFMKFTNCQCPKVAIENPLGIMSKLWKPHDQIIQPFEFGDPHRKRTCLWLKNLPQLIPTTPNAPAPTPLSIDSTGHKRYFTDSLNRSSTSRSKTFPGIARAMATQWTN